MKLNQLEQVTKLHGVSFAKTPMGSVWLMTNGLVWIGDRWSPNVLQARIDPTIQLDDITSECTSAMYRWLHSGCPMPEV